MARFLNVLNGAPAVERLELLEPSVGGQDELFKQILETLSKFYVDLRIRLEGGKITPLTRAASGAEAHASAFRRESP